MAHKIAIYAPHTGKNKTGVGVYAVDLLKGIVEFPEITSQSDFIFFVPSDFDCRLEPKENIQTRKLPTKSGDKFKRIFIENTFLPLSINKLKPQIFHSTSFTLPNFIDKKVKKIITVHDLIFFKFPSFYPGLNRFYYLNHFKNSIYKSDLIIADSLATQNDLINELFVPPHKITVCYPGISLNYNPGEEVEKLVTKEKLKLPNQFLLCVGRIEPRKNLLLIGDALKIIKAKYKLDIPLILVGNIGWQGEKILSALKTKVGNLLYLNYVPDCYLKNIYGLATAFLYPSLYEGFGLTILEAMAQKTPVIASNSSSIPEAAGDACILINPLNVGEWAEEIYNLISKENLRKKLVGKGLLQVKKFTLKNEIAELMNIYNSI